MVTGASSGLGAEYARQLAAGGDDVVLVARDATALETLATDLAARYGVRADVIAADLTDPTARAAVIERLAERDRPVTTLVNNAGYGLPLAFDENDVEQEAHHLALHNEVPLRLSHAALRTMRDVGGGRILNIASVAGFIPRSTYSACKAWLINFSRWANGYYRRDHITVTAVCPGYTHTHFHERLGLPPGQEGIPGWMWLDAPDVVAASLRDSRRGKAVSIPSARYKALVALTRLVPSSWAARIGERGR